MPFAMSNVKNPNVKLNAQIKDVKCSTAPSALLSANNLTVLLIAKLLNQNANQYVKNLNVTGNVINLLALNPSANSFAKIPTVSLKLNVALVHSELLKLLNHSPSLKKLKNKMNVANAKSKYFWISFILLLIQNKDLV